MVPPVNFGRQVLSEDLSGKVKKSGAVVLGEQIEVDGYFGRPIRVITHFHSDHTKGISYSSRKARSVIATRPTVEALKVLGVKLPEEKTLTLDYNAPLNLIDEKITLLYSRHIFGSAQVLVETKEHRREGYTGDFKFPGTTVMKDLDVLVIDATYGSPEMTRWFKNEIEDLFVDFISSLLSYGFPVTIYAYYGKMQEIMELIRRHGLSVPFLMPSKAYELTKVSVRHGFKIFDYFYEGSEEAQEIIRDNWFIRFLHYNASPSSLKSKRSYHLYVTGWIFDRPIKEVNYNGWKYIVGFSDHADFQDTIYYVEEATPKHLIVDCSRTTYSTAKRFKEEVSRRLPSVKIDLSPREPQKILLEED